MLSKEDFFQVQDWINYQISKGSLPTFTKFLPKIALALSIGILDNAYKKIAVWLNNKENHRLDDEHENHLIIKLILVCNSSQSCRSVQV